MLSISFCVSGLEVRRGMGWISLAAIETRDLLSKNQLGGIGRGLFQVDRRWIKATAVSEK